MMVASQALPAASAGSNLRKLGNVLITSNPTTLCKVIPVFILTGLGLYLLETHFKLPEWCADLTFDLRIHSERCFLPHLTAKCVEQLFVLFHSSAELFRSNWFPNRINEPTKR